MVKPYDTWMIQKCEPQAVRLWIHGRDPSRLLGKLSQTMCLGLYLLGYYISIYFWYFWVACMTTFILSYPNIFKIVSASKFQRKWLYSSKGTPKHIPAKFVSKNWEHVGNWWKLGHHFGVPNSHLSECLGAWNTFDRDRWTWKMLSAPRFGKGPQWWQRCGNLGCNVLYSCCNFLKYIIYCNILLMSEANTYTHTRLKILMCFFQFQ